MGMNWITIIAVAVMTVAIGALAGLALIQGSMGQFFIAGFCTLLLAGGLVRFVLMGRV